MTADFQGVPTTLVAGNSVNYTDLSTGTPTTWTWSFPGADVTSSSVQNPPNIVYSTPGTYNVSLTIGDGTSTSTTTKNNYITVTVPTTLFADFSASSTTVLQGQSINFIDQSINGPPTSWNWTFQGAVSTTSIVQNPIGIQYDIPGVYDVTLLVSDGTNSHSTTKTQYITVIDTSFLPVVDFSSDFTTVFVGGSVDFYDLTAGSPDSWTWYFPGAAPVTSTDQNPTIITYPTVGLYPVTLVVTNLIGSDSLTKTDYITVIDNSSVGPLYADFTADGSRLIVQGSTVSFHDLTVGFPDHWQWSFVGAIPASATDQHPTNILYTTPGFYDVKLIVNSGNYSDTIIKEDYIIVTSEPWQDPNGFCDTVTNMTATDIFMSFRHLTPTTWGYFPGHNGYTIRAYADKFTNYTFSQINGVLVPVVKASSASAGAKVRFIIWDVDTNGFPGNELTYKDVLISSFSPYIYHSVMFDNPAIVNGSFFVGYQLYYNTPVDTFVTYMIDRGQGGKNTMVVKKGTWKYPYQVTGDTLNASSSIELIGCLVKVDEINDVTEILIYPQPSDYIINVEFLDNYYSIRDIRLYDLLGRQQVLNIVEKEKQKMKINVSGIPSGIYILKISTGDKVISKKISVF
ncbi:MAG: PKD domain-containing protein [Bacteroidota bacterium]